MKMQMFCLYDSKAEVYGQPMFALNRGVIMRQITDAMGTEAMFAKYPADFELYYIGFYDDKHGTITADNREHVCGVIELAPRGNGQMELIENA